MGSKVQIPGNQFLLFLVPEFYCGIVRKEVGLNLHYDNIPNTGVHT